MNVLFLHHSTGQCIWQAGAPEWFQNYNAGKGTDYRIYEKAFPKAFPYGWSNYPFDYWNIWVRNAGPEGYQKPSAGLKGKVKVIQQTVLGKELGEPTLEMLTKQYQVIMFKHCFPVSDIDPDTGSPDVSSPSRRLENYQLHYHELKKKLHEFPETRFILWTGAALVQKVTTEEKAARAKAFFEWVKTEWDQPGDNIFLFDFHQLETGGGLYLKDEYASGPKDSHPNPDFSKRVVPLLGNRIVSVVEGRGDETSLTGE